MLSNHWSSLQIIKDEANQPIVQSKLKTLELILIYCSCHCGDDGLKMVVCEQCEEWYHYRCINKETIEENAAWCCTKCHP